MKFPLSAKTIQVLAEVISGGSANGGKEPIGLYRSGPKIERFMRGCNIDFQLTGSRLPSLEDCLADLNRGPEAAKLLPSVIEAAAHPSDFPNDLDKHAAVVNALNQALAYDGFELVNMAGITRLCEHGKSSPVVSGLSTAAGEINFDTVSRDLGRALESVDADPEDAITSACSTIESVCRSILLELQMPLPNKKDVSSLYRAVQTPLGLSPDRADVPDLVAEDVKKVLGGFASVITHIGHLRTHAGDAHGRERGFKRVDGRIARLAVHSASTASLFLIETWQKEYPMKVLYQHQ